MFENQGCRKIQSAIVVVGLLVLAGCSSESGDASGPTPVPSVAAPKAGTSTLPQSERAVDAESLPYAEIGEQLVYGYFTFPSDMIEPLPAIILVHDWWGLNDNVRAEASRLAAAGYMVLAIDLYGGESVTYVESARAKMIAVLEQPDDVASNLQQAIEFVRIAGAPRIATLGWGLGGGLSLDAAILYPEHIDSAVIFYGRVSDDPERLRQINAPVLGFFGERDRGIKIAAVREFEAAMQRLRLDLTLKIYEGIGHGFADPLRSGYDPDAAADAWNRTLEFLDSNLSAAGES